MKPKQILRGLIIFATGVSALAMEPVDTPAYKILISSPLEHWSGNESELKSSAEGHAAKEASYRVKLQPGRAVLLGHPTFFDKPNDHPVIQGANARLVATGFSLARDSGNFFQIEPPLIVPREDVAVVFSNQAQLRKRSVIAQGDPETLQSRVATKKIAGAFVALGATLIAADKLGASMGSSLTLDTGISGDFYQVVARHRTAITPVSFEVDQPESYAQVELRRVTSRQQERTGQVAILYKVSKTSEIEAAALQDAIVALSGSALTPDQIQAARAKDFTERKEIWRECLESGACKK